MKFLAKVWGELKELPGWAWGAFIGLLALVYFLVKKVFLQQAVMNIERERSAIEVDRINDIVSSANEEAVLIAKIEEDHDAKTVALDKRKEELEAAIASGPQGIADAWNSRLRGSQ